MAVNKKLLAVALLLTANTAGASKAIDSFTKDTHKKLDTLKKASVSWNEAGSRNIKRGALMMAPIVAVAKAASDLEDKVADIAKITNDDFGSKGFKELEIAATEVAEHLGRLPSEAAELMSELAAGGVARDQLKEIAKQAGEIGVAFDISAGEAGSAFMKIMNAMNLTMDEAMKGMDAMNALTNRFGGKPKELVQFMTEGGASVAQTLKVSAHEMAAFGNAFQVVGISASESATTMTRFQKAILTSATAARIFNKAGGGSAGIIAVLEAAQKSGNAAQWFLRNKFGEYSTKLAQMANNMNADKGVIAQLSIARNESAFEGSAYQEFLNRQRTTSEQFNKLKVNVVNASAAIGSTLLPVINDLFIEAKPLVKKFTEFIQNNQELTKKILKTWAAFAAGRMALGFAQKGIGGVLSTSTKLINFTTKIPMLTKKVKSFFLAFSLASNLTYYASIAPKIAKVSALLSKSFLSIGKAVMIAGRFMLANPIVLIAGAIAGAAYLIYKNWEPIKGFFINLWDNIKVVFSKTWEWIKSMFLKYTPHGLIIKHWDKIKDFFEGLWNSVKLVFTDTWEGIKNLFLNYTPHGLIIQHWDKIPDYFSGLWDKVKSSFSSVFDWIVRKFGWINDKILKPLGKGLGFNGGDDITINTPRTRQSVMPLPVYSSPANANMSFAPVININGSADSMTANKIIAQIRRDFEKQMRDYQHNQNRKALS